MSERTYETTAVVHELLDTLKGLDQRFLSGERAVGDDPTPSERDHIYA